MNACQRQTSARWPVLPGITGDMRVPAPRTAMSQHARLLIALRLDKPGKRPDECRLSITQRRIQGQVSVDFLMLRQPAQNIFGLS